jgi:hypothetical protein
MHGARGQPIVRRCAWPPGPLARAVYRKATASAQVGQGISLVGGAPTTFP